MSAVYLGSLLALLAGLLTIVGNVYAKEWATRQGIFLFIVAVLFYLAGSIVFPFSLRLGALSVLSTLSSLSTIIITLVIGLFWYHEQLTIVQVVGLLMAVFAMVLLMWPR